MQKLMSDGELDEKLAQFKAYAEARAAVPDLPPANPPDGDMGCEDCQGAGWVQRPDDGRYTRCQCVLSHFEPADGVPYEFHQVTLDTYGERHGQATALTRARLFVESVDRRDLFLFGGVGAGKTRLACAIVNTLSRRRVSVLFARVPQLLHALQPGRDASEATELERRLWTRDVLVLDDVGAERDMATDYTRRTLWMIYEERGDRGLRTIWTSNKSLQELSAMQDDDRLASRIAGRADVVKVSASDQRVAKRRQEVP